MELIPFVVLLAPRVELMQTSILQCCSPQDQHLGLDVPRGQQIVFCLEKNFVYITFDVALLAASL